MSSIAFVLGNGESRRGIDIDDLKEKGTVFACNGVYRTHRPHYLIAVDPKMINEIAETDYMIHNKVWSNYNAHYGKNKKILDHVNWFKPSLGWSSGPTALRFALEQGFKEIYILGFDYQGHAQSGKNQGHRFNNIFKDTRNYKKSNEMATFHGNWLNQTKRCVQDFPDVKFHRVIPTGWFIPKDLQGKFTKGNIDHPSISEFLAKFNLTLKN
tara:strand:- start:83 stop:718 length:636 start_codon:yes stop_codon:yes gene_type:complete